MQVKTVTEQEWYTFNPAIAPAAKLFVEEKRFYVRDDKLCLGVVVLDKHDKDWGWVLLAKEKAEGAITAPDEERFRAVNMKASLPTAEVAEKQLLEEMQMFRRN